MLGSVSEADDALQEAWLRIGSQHPENVQNMQAWLTTVVGHICLNMLRSRRLRSDLSWDVHVPDPVVVLEGSADPEQEALIADSIGLALQVVLDSLNPAERLTFVLHDVFGVPFSEIACVLDRSEAATQQLASRARRRVRRRARTRWRSRTTKGSSRRVLRRLTRRRLRSAPRGPRSRGRTSDRRRRAPQGVLARSTRCRGCSVTHCDILEAVPVGAAGPRQRSRRSNRG